MNAENPSLEMVPTFVETITSVSEAIAVPGEVITMVVPEITPVAEAVSDVFILVESADNVSKSSDVIIDPPQTGNE